jgi:DNA (cytosine-5)-methyltransferase 1
MATHSRTVLQGVQLSYAYWRALGMKRKPRHEWPRRTSCDWKWTISDPEPWLTVRQALAGLPEPPQQVGGDPNHWLIPGARLYPRHSGSELDWPSKAIKSGVHGVSGGENVLVHDDGSYRYFSLREMARLQGFPDGYEFVGPRSRIIGQIGNAVPCQIGKMLGTLILEVFDRARRKRAAHAQLSLEWR